MPDDGAGQAAGRVLVISQLGRAPRELHDALRADGFQVDHLATDELSPAIGAQYAPDIVLASASLGLPRLGLLEDHLAQPGEGTPDRMPNILVFPEGGGLADLVDCVGGGFDYITPPFLPGLLRSRVSSCGDRSRLQSLVAKMAAEASLHDYEQQLGIARNIQMGFLPETTPSIAGWQIATRFRPAKEVAGDFYDIFELTGGRALGLVIADVCDKGLGAALFMAIFRTLLRHSATGTRPLATMSAGSVPLMQAIIDTNRYMTSNHLRQGYFATVFFAILEPASGDLLYVNGGHNPPVLVPGTGRHRLLDPTGPAVGMLADSTFSLGQARLAPGDALLMYTDGVTEARNEDGQMFGLDRLLDVAVQPGRTAHQLADLVDRAVRGHAGYAEQADDITMLFMSREPGETLPSRDDLLRRPGRSPRRVVRPLTYPAKHPRPPPGSLEG